MNELKEKRFSELANMFDQEVRSVAELGISSMGLDVFESKETLVAMSSAVNAMNLLLAMLTKQAEHSEFVEKKLLELEDANKRLLEKEKRVSSKAKEEG